jgi:hypothetical protein
VYGDASVLSSRNATSSHNEESSYNEKSGGFLSPLDCGLEEEDSEPSVCLQKKRNRTVNDVYLQKKRSRTINEDAFSATSSEEEGGQQPIKIEERLVNVRDSGDLLSLVDSIVGSSMGPGPSLADLVWLESKIREKDAALPRHMR